LSAGFAAGKFAELKKRFALRCALCNGKLSCRFADSLNMLTRQRTGLHVRGRISTRRIVWKSRKTTNSEGIHSGLANTDGLHEKEH